jgi:L-lactate dehydrogenase complex protein LldG
MRTATPDTVVGLLTEATPNYTCTRTVMARFPQVAQVATTNAEEVVAAGEFAVAETGSVLLNEPADDRGRCYLAERLWLLVPEHELVPSLDEALERIARLVKSGAAHPVLMSGPSRTADIERVLTIGVHGPRALVIVVVGSGGSEVVS